MIGSVARQLACGAKVEPRLEGRSISAQHFFQVLPKLQEAVNSEISASVLFTVKLSIWK